ncbi:efflux RND transporter permease subunit [Ferrimonas pelagia]|uniref:Efflux RND transporter permease subunit n=1 Tax=Ferrimonas pelagia TaxID=1177826 RepID=A0ABP9FE66_9GAMM
MSQQPQQEIHSGIISWFARNPVAANLLMVIVIALGLLSLGQLRKETFPSIAPDRVTVSVVYQSGSAAQAEEGIALKIEEALESVLGIQRITSTSNSMGSTVVVERTSGYDLNTLLRDVKTEVDAISSFPADAENPVISSMRKQDHAVYLQLSGDVDQSVLQSLGMQLKQDALALSSVNEVKLVGKAEPMIAIEISDHQLRALGLTFSELSQKVNAESLEMITSTLRDGNKTLRLKGASQQYSAEEFRALPLVEDANGVRLRLGDVATVTDTYEDEPTVMSRFDGVNGFAVQLVMGEQADVTRMVAQAQTLVEQWQGAEILPEGVSLQSWYERDSFITERIALMMDNAVKGMALVFIILALFMNLRVAFWVAMGLPFVFLGTFFFMGEGLLGLTINDLTSFGFIIALGIVVDDAVVIGESVYATRKAEGDTLANTIRGTLRVAVPTLFGVLTTVAAFVPLALIEGRMGQIFAQFAVVVSVCLLLSMVQSKLVLPSHLAHLNTQVKPSRFFFVRAFQSLQRACQRGLSWAGQRVYLPLLRQAMALRYATMAVLLTLFVLVTGMVGNGTVRFVFFPDIPADVVNVSVEMEHDTGFGQTQHLVGELEQWLWQADDALRGEQDTGIDHVLVNMSSDNAASLTVALQDADTRPYSAAQLVRQWRALAGSPEGVRQLQITDAMRMIDNFKLELKHSDSAVLEQVGDHVLQALQATPGVLDMNHSLDRTREQWQVELNDAGRALGLSSESIARQLLQMYDGETVQRFQRGQDEVKVKIRYPQAERSHIGQLMQAQVRTDDGTTVPLSAVATLVSGRSMDEITRINGQRSVWISASVDKGSLSPMALQNQLKAQTLADLQAKYPGLDVYFAGEAEEQDETLSSMLLLTVGAMLAIYALLAIPLGSYGQPLIIMLAIPFGAVGAILGHWINGLPLAIMSLFGMLALAGVVVNNSLLMVAAFNDLRQQGVAFKAAVEQACISRFRPILLTSATTFAGLSPLLTETSIQAQLLIPGAASLGYGILFGTVITLVMIPAALQIGEDLRILKTKVLRIGAARLPTSQVEG